MPLTESVIDLINWAFDTLASRLGLWPALIAMWLVPPALWWLLIWWLGHPVVALIVLAVLLVVWGLILAAITINGTFTGKQR